MRYVIPLLMLGLFGVAFWLSTSTHQPDADFRFINRGTITTLDPAAMSWMQDIRLALTIYEGLYAYHPETTLPIPGSAHPPKISEDRRTYTFRIRDEARWSNGDPLTADDFVFAWRRAFEPGTAADYSFFFHLIEGVPEYTQWRIEATERLGKIGNDDERETACEAHLREADRRFAESVRIRALDDKTLEVRLVRPVAYFLDLCAFSIFVPLHRASVERFRVDDEAHNGLIYYDEQWVKPGNTHHNGPYTMTDWQFKRSITVRKNPHYWDIDNVHLDSIEMVDVHEPNSAWLSYDGGRVDWLSSIDTDYTPELIASSHSPLPGSINHTGTTRNDIHAFPAFGTYFYNFNCGETLPDGSPNPFKDPRVRQAFTMAVDKQLLIDEVVRLGNPVATTFVPPDSIPGYPRVEGLPYDPEAARQLLAEAGYPDGKGIPEIEILYNTGFQHGKIAQAIMDMWIHEFGISGHIKGLEVKTFRVDKRNTNYVICRASWYGDYGDPTTFLEMFQTENGNNDSDYSDPVYDKMLEDAEMEIDPQKRLELLAEAERYLVNETLPLLPLYQYVNVFAFDPDHVKNLYLTPRMMTVLKAVEVAP